jgi:hypothetical protein
MGNENSHSIWRQPALAGKSVHLITTQLSQLPSNIARSSLTGWHTSSFVRTDIARYGNAKGRYANCPQTMQQAKLAAELSKKAMQKGTSLGP